MITIQRDKTNIIQLTLDETMRDKNNHILLTLTNEMQTDMSRFAILKDNLSAIPNRIDGYLITEVSDPADVDIATAHIELPRSGFWHYIAEEVEPQINFNFDGLVIVKLLEIGRCNVIGDGPLSGDSVYS